MTPKEFDLDYISLTRHFLEPSRCPQLSEHKSHLVSFRDALETFVSSQYPLQHSGQFVITFPRVSRRFQPRLQLCSER
jgi:trans-aconitate methyltransferase